MAINFLNTVDLNSIQIENIVPENATAGTIGAGVLGQMYFDTAQDTMMQYVADSDGAGNPGYIEIGATSAVESLIAGAGIGVSAAIGNITVRNTGLISVLDGTFIDLTKQGGGDNTQLTADLSAVDGTSTAADRFLTKANKWATIPFGDITEVQGGTYISVTNQTGPIPIVNHDLTTRTDTTSTASPASGATFTAIDSVTTNTTGHVTALNVKTVTLPPEIDTTYTLPVAAGASNTAQIILTPSTGVTNTVSFIGTTGRIAISETTGINGSIGIDFPTNVVTVGSLEVGTTLAVSGTGTSSFSGPLDMGGPSVSKSPKKILNVATGTAATDGVNLGQVELLVAGVGVFQGGYDANTGLTVPGGLEIEGASNIALDKGDYFVVTTAGTAFFGVSLEPGDFIFAETAITANSNPPVGDYIVVRADDNVAGAGATDGATQKGVSGFDSENFTVSSNGWVQLKPLANPYGAKVALTGGDNTTAGQTTFTVDVTALFAGADARNCKVEVLLDAGGLTVYPEVTRNGSGDVLLEFMPQVGNNLYSALITIV